MTLKRLTQFALMLALAVPVVSAADLKLGYVDGVRLLEEAPQAQDATRRLQREFASREEEIVRKQDEIRRMEEALERDGAVMSESDRRNRNLEILSRKRELRRMQEEFREDVNIRRNDALGSLQELIKEVIQEVGSSGKFDLIFYDGIAYADKGLDVTEQVLEGLARRHQSRSGNR